MSIKYVIGDATDPQGDSDYLYIAHIVNNVGKWGHGFVVPLGKKYPEAKYYYNKWHESYDLGEFQLVPNGDKIFIVNMFAQDGIKSPSNQTPIRYDALRSCLHSLAHKIRIAKEMAKKTYSIHMPRIGCGLAGGSWDKVEPIILEELKDIEVTVYDLIKN